MGMVALHAHHTRACPSYSCGTTPACPTPPPPHTVFHWELFKISKWGRPLQIRNQTTVNLSAERLGDEGFEYIIDALSFNDTWADLIPSTFTMIMAMRNWTALSMLKTHIGCFLFSQLIMAQSGCGRITAHVLAVAQCSLPCLCAHCRTPPHPIPLIHPPLHPCCSCKAADFSKVGAGPRGATQLCQALASNTALESLLLETNNLGDEGAAALAGALAGEPPLPCFCFFSVAAAARAQQPGGGGAAALAGALAGEPRPHFLFPATAVFPARHHASNQLAAAPLRLPAGGPTCQLRGQYPPASTPAPLAQPARASST